MVQILYATQFQRFMTSGRTTPGIFGCDDAAGRWAGEYVVKLRGGLETRESGLMREMLAAQLAGYFSINTPEPAIIMIESTLAELITQTEPSHARLVRDSIGLNFGTKLLTGCSTWPVDKSIPEAVWQAAVDIFAFDALIQNPDRRYGNPNLLTKSDTLFAYDHEMSFSFLLEILPSPVPWKLDKQCYLNDHVFYRKLKSKPIDVMGFTDLLSRLSDAEIANLIKDLPIEWRSDNLTRIESHLRTMREHANEFAEEIRRILI